RPIMERTLNEIRSGKFTEEWEKKITKLKFKVIKYFATRQKINRLEKQVRTNMKMKLFDIYEEEPPTAEEIRELEKIYDEIKLFEEYYEK
ncbi:MAG: hypothetical protein ACFE85_19895, partial [Candidatus Hodarchaeota archaeon]